MSHISDISYKGYFDYAAATPMKTEVIKAMEPFFSENFYNPSAIYLKAAGARKQLEEARHVVAQTIGARPTEIIFTAGGTEANNLAIKGVMLLHPTGQIITSPIEHESVLSPAKNFNHQTVKVNPKGIVDIKDLAANITDSTVLVSIMYVNNESGSIQPISEIAEIIRQVKQNRQQKGVKTPLYFHTDACQAANYLDLSVSRLGIDFMTINGGKIYGPKQSGVLYIRAGIQLKPLIDGGGQENGLRSGTENVASAVGFAKALQLASKNHKLEAKRLAELQQKAFRKIKNELPRSIINGPSGGKRVANNIHLSIPGADNEYLLMQLDEAGYQVATGSACSASNDEPSHVLQAMGVSDDMAHASIRITMGQYTEETEILNLINTIVKLTSK